MSVDVVDVGANPIDGTAPYQRLLDDGVARLVGFEPNLDALTTLNERKGPNETYLPFAVADGRNHKIRYCIAPGMTSLLEPNAELYRYFHGKPYPSASGTTKCGSRASGLMIRTNHEPSSLPEGR
jgi:hypothetical protein